MNSVSRQLPTAMKHKDASASTSATEVTRTRNVSNNVNGRRLGNGIQTTHETRFVQLESHLLNKTTSPEQNRNVLVLGEKKVVNRVERMITKNDTRHNVAPVLVDVVAPFP